jgi:N utilization substance protein B
MMLFRLDFFDSQGPKPDLSLIPENEGPENLKKLASEFTAQLLGSQKELDDLIQSASQSWKLERMATVDRNLMRLALFEMLFLDPPTKPAIIINEAVEMAKMFGTQDSGAFVNGLLDQIRREKGLN